MSGFSERSTRSRVSSPFAGNGTPQPTYGLADAAKKKTFMDRWVEPPRPAPRPSFAEAGFERGGTVANMAPLGTLPSSKVIKSVAKDSTERIRKDEASDATTPETPLDTPEPTAPPPPQRSPTPQPGPEINQPSPQTPRDQMSLPPSPQKMDVDDPDLLDPDVLGMSPLPEESTNQQRRSISLSSPLPRYIRHRGEAYTPELDEEGLPIVDLEFTDKVIEDAVQWALDFKRWPTAYALRTLYDDLRTDMGFVRIIEAVYYERATSKELGEFDALVRAKKREGQQERTAEYYFNGDEGYDPPQKSRPVLDAVSAALTYDNLRPGSARSISDLARSASIPLPSPSHPSFPQQYPFGAPGTAMGIPPSMPHLTTYVTPYTINQPRPYASPYAQNAGNIVTPPNPAYSMSVSGAAGAPTATTARAHRSGSESSSSSLSSIDEDLIQSHEVEDSDEERAYADSPRKVRNRAFQPGRGAAEGSKPKIRLAAGNRKNATATPQHPPSGSANTNANSHNISTRARSDNSISRNSTPAETLVSQVHNGRLSTKAQPMANTAPPKARQGPKIHTFKTSTNPTSTSASTPTHPTSSSTQGRTTNNSANTNGDMAPARLLPDSTTASISSKTSDAAGLEPLKGKLQGKNKKQNLIQNSNIPSYDENDEISRLKRAARKKTNESGEVYISEVRHPLTHLSPPAQHAAEDTASEGGDYLPLPSKRPPKKGGRIVLTTRETRNRYNDNSENSSPTLLSFQPDIAPGSVSVSRAGTPLVRATRKAKTGSGLRVKTSPVKKKGGIVAGVPRDSRLSGERASPGPGGPDNRDDNDDFCGACGGNGDIVCCDGCNKSFHFKCIDPPMIEGALPDSWYCNTCEFKHNSTRESESQNSTFGALLHNLKSKNPEAFRLPEEIRKYFEGVQTGGEGEYEEPAPPKTAKNRGGYDEVPDYFRTKDSKGKLILCHSCDEPASSPSRAIIPCSFCGLYWHLDCLENPMAKEPHLSRQWRCPAHIDDILDVLPAILGPAHRWRRIKGSYPITPYIPRGSKNDGHIEIENSLGDDGEEMGFSDEVQYGMVYRLPAAGIKLDFISKVKQQGGGISRSGYLNRQMSAPQVAPLNTRELEVQQAALSMAALATQAPALSIDSLVKTLQVHAPTAVLDTLSRVDASALAHRVPLSASDLENLGTIQKLIANVLAGHSPAEIEDDEDLGEPARKKAKLSNSVDAEEDTSMSL